MCKLVNSLELFIRLNWVLFQAIILKPFVCSSLESQADVGGSGIGTELITDTGVSVRGKMVHGLAIVTTLTSIY